MATLAELVAAAQAGDRGAFCEACRLCRGMALRVALRRLRWRDEDAEEAVQEGTLRVWRGLGMLREPAAFPAYLARAVARCADNVARKRRRSRLRHMPSGAPRLEDPAGGPGEGAALGELRAAVRAAVAELPPCQREAVEAFYFGPHDYPSARRELGVPDGTLKRRLHCGRRRLRKALKGLA